MGSPVREHQAVHAEVSVMRILSCISAVMVHLPSILRFPFIGGVVAPLPDKAAAEAIVFVDLLHIILNVSGAVSHGVHELTLDKRFFLAGCGKIFINLPGRSIHMAFHIQHGFILHMSFRLEMAALIMHQSGGIILLHPASRFLDVGAHAGLIAQRPENDTALVLIPDHVAPAAVNHSLSVSRIFRELTEGFLRTASVLILHAMGFQIRLRDHIKTVFAAQLREPGRIGIMAGTDGVDIRLLHDAQVEHGVHPRNHSSGKRAAVMTVDTLEFHRLFIDQHHAVFNGDGTDSHLLADRFLRRADFHRIKIRLLRVPQNRMLHGKGNRSVRARRLLCKQRFPVIQGAFHLRRSHRIQPDPDLRAVLFKIHRRGHRVILHPLLRAQEQMHIPENAGHAEFILILQIASITPFQHQDGQTVSSCLRLSRDVELAGAVGNLAVAHEFSVHPHIKAGIHSFEIEELLLLRLIFIQIKILDIGSAGIVVRHIGRITGKGITGIGVMLLIKARHLPAGRYLQPAEALLIKILFVKFRNILDAGKISEPPVHAGKEPPRLLFLSVERHIPASRFLTSHMQDFRVLIVFFQNHTRL